jgi:hypothetical protein
MARPGRSSFRVRSHPRYRRAVHPQQADAASRARVIRSEALRHPEVARLVRLVRSDAEAWAELVGTTNAWDVPPRLRPLIECAEANSITFFALTGLIALVRSAERQVAEELQRQEAGQ